MAITPPGAYVEDTGTPKGRGVFAARPFHAGETVEVCPVILFCKPYRRFGEKGLKQRWIRPLSGKWP